MNGVSNLVRRRRRVVFDAALLFVVILLMTQMWLLTATLESYLGGHGEAALPGLIISAFIAMACFTIYRLLRRLDNVPEHTQPRSAHGPWRIE